MLRQAFTVPSRALRSGSRSAATQSLLRTPFQTSLPASLRAAPTPASRWYSAESTPGSGAETANGEAKAGNAAEAKGTAGSEAEAELKKKLEAKEKEVIDWKDKYVRSVADFRNLQDRTQREMKSARDFAIQRFAKDLVDSVDNLDRALLTVPENKLKTEEKSEHLQDLVNLYEGLKMTESILMQTLAKHGLERFDPHGEKFNPNEHDATFMAPQPDKDDGTVFHVQQKGFKLNGRIVRPAKVGVVKNS